MLHQLKFEHGLTQEEKDEKYFSKFGKKEYKVNVNDLLPLPKPSIVGMFGAMEQQRQTMEENRKRN